MDIMEETKFWERLPHAYPFRMMDRVLEVVPGKRATVLKNVSGDEPFLHGHASGEPVLPAVVLLEAMAQTGGLAFLTASGLQEGGPPFLAGVDEFRMKKKVIPGDQVILEATVDRIFSNLAMVRVVARVDNEIAAEGRLVLAIGSAVDG